MSRNLVMCLDGTWNKADAPHPTNVLLTRDAAQAADADQLVYYDPGVGTGRWDRVRGGVLGMGLAKNVEEAYRWLCRHFRLGDRIFLLGYSRGAYTARSVTGLIGLCGIPYSKIEERGDSAALARSAMDIYRVHDLGLRAQRAWEWRCSHFCAEPPIPVHFLGVWDTVGSLGVPLDGLRWIGARRHRWHDVTLGGHIKTACHLVAIDEQRRSFAPSLWTSRASGATEVEQVWFPGVHDDVGGGREDRGLSDRALAFMWARARSSGLSLHSSHDPTLRPMEDCRPGDSMTAPYRLLGSYQRPIAARGRGRNRLAVGEKIHPTAIELLECRPEYRRSASGVQAAAALADGLPVA